MIFISISGKAVFFQRKYLRTDATRILSWTLTLVIVLLAIGFPIVAILSWIFDITPEGLKKTEPARVAKGKDQPEPVKRKLRISDLIIVVLVVVVVILAYPRVFKSKASLRAMTIPVTIVDEFGENEKHLEQCPLVGNHLTGFSGLLARRGVRRGLPDHKEPATQSSGHEKPASGGPYRPVSIVPTLARCSASRFAPRREEPSSL